MVVIDEACAEWGGEEPLGEVVAGGVVPPRTLVADARGRQHADDPLEEQAARKPRVGPQRREADRAALDGLGDPDPGVSQAEVAGRGVRIRSDAHHPLDEFR